MNISWSVIVVIAIFAIAIVAGFFRGFLRGVLTVGHLFISIALMVVISPYVQTFLSGAGFEDMVRGKIETVIEEKVEEMTQGKLADEASQYFYLDIGDSLINEFANEHQSELTTEEQNEIIKGAMPSTILSDLLAKHNTAEEYARLGAESLSEYIAAYLAEFATRIVAALIVFILAEIIFHILIAFSSVIGKLPVIGGINKVMGALLGVLIGLGICWLFFLIMTMFLSTNTGALAMEGIMNNGFTRFIYELNPFMSFLN